MRVSMERRGRERKRENPKQTPCGQHRAWLTQGSISQTVRSWPGQKPRVRCLTDWATQVHQEKKSFICTYDPLGIVFITFIKVAQLILIAILPILQMRKLRPQSLCMQSGLSKVHWALQRMNKSIRCRFCVTTSVRQTDTLLMQLLSPKVCGDSGSGDILEAIRSQNVKGDGNWLGLAEKESSLSQVTKLTSGFTCSQ